MTGFEQVHGNVVGIGNHLAILGLLAKEGADIGEDVECTTRFLVKTEAGDVFHSRADEVATTLELLTHLFDTILRSVVSRFGSFLSNARTPGGVLALELANCLGDIGGGSTETDAPACHGVSLRHTIDDDYAILHLGEGSNGRRLSAVGDMLVYFVGYDDDLRILGEHLDDSCKFLLGVDGTGGVGGRAEEERLGAWGDEAFELMRQNLEVLLLATKERHVDAFGQLDHLEVAHPCWGGDDHFVTLVNDGEDDIADFLFGAITHYNLRRREIQAILTFELAANGLAEGHVARYRSVE